MILGIDNLAKDNLESYGNVEIGKNLMNFYLDASIAGFQFDYSSNMNINLNQLSVTIAQTFISARRPDPHIF